MRATRLELKYLGPEEFLFLVGRRPSLHLCQEAWICALFVARFRGKKGTLRFVVREFEACPSRMRRVRSLPVENRSVGKIYNPASLSHLLIYL